MGFTSIRESLEFNLTNLRYPHSYGGYDSAGWGHGVRNLLFHTPDPKAGVETWIRLQEGETKARIILDNDYGR